MVVEIGCQNLPGPFFEGADRHYIVDPDAESLAEGARKNPAFTPVIADASNLDFLADASVNTMLARNVFGDPALFTDKTKREAMQDEVITLLNATKIAETHAYMVAAEVECAELKSNILQEAGRVLVEGGQLVVVEQYSPRIAERFFKAIAGDPELTGGLDIRATSLLAVTPADYASHHANSQTWVAQKQ